MKRSFYEVLGVAHDASESAIADSYALALAKLDAKNVRGVGSATMELNLLREGYLILSDPQKRAIYDAKLAASRSGVELMFFPSNSSTRRRLENVVFLVLTVVLGAVVYFPLSSKMDEVRVEHAQAVARKMEEQYKVRTIDATAPAGIASLEHKR